MPNSAHRVHIVRVRARATGMRTCTCRALQTSEEPVKHPPTAFVAKAGRPGDQGASGYIEPLAVDGCRLLAYTLYQPRPQCKNTALLDSSTTRPPHFLPDFTEDTVRPESLPEGFSQERMRGRAGGERGGRRLPSRLHWRAAQAEKLPQVWRRAGEDDAAVHHVAALVRKLQLLKPGRCSRDEQTDELH